MSSQVYDLTEIEYYHRDLCCSNDCWLEIKAINIYRAISKKQSIWLKTLLINEIALKPIIPLTNYSPFLFFFFFVFFFFFCLFFFVCFFFCFRLFFFTSEIRSFFMSWGYWFPMLSHFFVSKDHYHICKFLQIASPVLLLSLSHIPQWTKWITNIMIPIRFI